MSANREGKTEQSLSLLRALLANRQVPDANRISITVGEVRALVATLDKSALAQAIRFVEATRANIEGYVWEGPEPEWFDGYAEDIAEQYNLLTMEAHHA